MVSVCKKLLVLTWKCYLLRRRNWFLTLFDLVAPLAVIYMARHALNRIMYGDNSTVGENIGTVVYDPPKTTSPKPSYKTEIAYCPVNSVTRRIMDKYYDIAHLREYPAPLDKEEEILTWMMFKTDSLIKHKRLPYGVVFIEQNKRNHFKYKLKHLVPIPTETVIQNTGESDVYEDSMFLETQLFIDIALMKSIGINVQSGFIGKFPRIQVSELYVIFIMTYILMTIAYVFLVITIIRDVIQEKYSGIKELMAIMGVSRWMIWFQWVIYTFMAHLPVTIIATLFFTCCNSPVIQANFVIVWLLLFLFTLNCMLLLFVLTCFFDKAVMGTLISVSAWFIIHFIAMLNFNPKNLSFITQVTICLLPLHNLIWALYTLNSFYFTGVPWTLKHLFSTRSTDSYISVGISLIIFILETIVLIIILIFLDGVNPGPYGVRKPITFMCGWFKRLRRNSEDPDYARSSLPKTYEPPPKELNVGIEIRDLHKRYGLIKKVVAVENVDLDIYEGEIMALLGHNGAGKTTTMSMIVGMFSPTKGVIRFNGQDISKDSSYRNSLGICTQHNLYFPKLTVIEHLIFFGMLRGMSFKEAQLEGLELLDYLDMHKKTKSFGKDLSGGMKRRLCLAVSLMGNPKYLILDEPTSGLDPQSRRKLWNIILSMRGQRTVLITTHFMEEADVLSDRIAIMDHGNIVCCGTNMFLKRIYGTGYHLHILKTANASPVNILSKIRQHVANPQMKLLSPTQIDVTITSESVELFPGMFAVLEDNRESLGITSISVTCTTMEDVFLGVSNKGKEEENTTGPNIIEDKPNNWDHIKGFELLLVRYTILLWKALRYHFRKIILTLIKLFITSLMICLLVKNTVITEGVPRDVLPPLLLNLDIFKGYSSVIVHDDESEHVADIATNILENHKWTITNLPLSTNITTYIIDLFFNNYDRYSKLLLALQITNNTITILHQNLLHLSAVAANLFSNIMLRYLTSDNSSIIQAINHPYAFFVDSCAGSYFNVYIIPFAWTMVFFFSLLVLTMGIIPFLTEERVNGFKHQQILAGVSPLLYWLAHFTFDYFLYMCIVFIYIIIIAVMGGKLIITSGFIGLLLLVLSLYGISGIFFVYLFTLFIDGVFTSLSLYMISNILITTVQYYVIGVLPSTIMNHIFCLNPLYNLLLAMTNIGSGIYHLYVCEVCKKQNSCNISNRPFLVIQNGILLHLLYLGLTWMLYFAIILIWDYGCTTEILLTLFHTPYKHDGTLDEDDDVKKECNLIRTLKRNSNLSTSLRVEGLSKKYFCGPKAVINVSFVVFPGECFGLLGVNGAGKTTTFKMLSGEIFPNSGDSVILNHSVIKERRKYQSCIGYCPQFDAIVNSLSGEDIITIIGRLRGIPRNVLKEEVDKWVKALGITEYVTMQSGTYSGGTKRKLSTAMAFIGNPVVVFLDEPTSGVDPESRRNLWTVMESRLRAGQAMVLTSHSMEECEALCTRLTIMKDGKMMCIGSPEYLKNKFTQGYTVLLKLENPTKDNIESLKEAFKKQFPISSIVDEHMTHINFQIVDPHVSLSQLFTIMLQLKRKYEFVEDFSVSNTSMEQLFMSFVKEKKDAS